jgi:hypothetical protein
MQLTGNELDAGLQLVERTNLSNLLPHAFEVKAIRQSWVPIRKMLEGVDLRTYQPQPAITLVSPKQKWAVRPIHLLDPLDTLLYTALVWRLAPKVEAGRRPLSEKSVFSHRFTPSASPWLTSYWNDFQNRLRELSTKHQYVAAADIADYYPNVYLHRLENALSHATKMAEESKVIARWLAKWSPSGVATSQGIPVGPIASNFLGEAVLIEVDDFLADRNLVFARYLDDYYIFCDSQPAAVEALYSLGERLRLEEHLGLNTAKTRVMSSESFRDRIDNPRPSVRAKRQEFVEQVLGGDPYAHVAASTLSKSAKTYLEELDAEKMLDNALKGDIVNLTNVGIALQALGALQKASAADKVLSRLDLLAPASRDVGNFLIALDSLPAQVIQGLAKKVLQFIDGPEFKSAYQVIWLLEPFTRSQVWDEDAALIAVLERYPNVLVRRQALLALSLSPKRASLIELKKSLSDASPWLRRAALFGIRFLPRDERTHAYPNYTSTDWTVATAVDHAVVEYSRASAPSSV